MIPSPKFGDGTSPLQRCPHGAPEVDFLAYMGADTGWKRQYLVACMNLNAVRLVLSSHD